MRRVQAGRRGGRVSSDDGWHADRDLSLSIGRWARLDLRALVEEHAGGRCLVRVGLRLRPTRAGALALVAAIVLMLALTVLGQVARVPLAATGAVVAGTLVLLAAFWNTWQTTAGVERALGMVAEANEWTALDQAPRPGTLAPRAVWQAAAVTLTSVLAVWQSGLMVVDLTRDWLMPPAVQASTAPGGPGRLGLPGGLAVAPNGDLYVANASSDTITRLRASSLRRPALRTAGLPASPGAMTVVRFDNPGGVALGPRGELYIADTQNHRVCRLDRHSGVIVTVAGLGVPGFNGDGRPAASAMLNTPRAVAVASDGDLYIADTLNNRIRVVSAATGIIRTIAGDGLTAPEGDVRDGGPATLAHLYWPTDLALAAAGDVFVADMKHNRIRRIDGRTGLITTVAGSGAFGDRGDGGAALEASLAGPAGLALATEGSRVTIYVADYFNRRVRMVTPDGVMRPVPAASAVPVGAPSRVAYHPEGWLYVADTDRDRVTVLPLRAPDTTRRQVGPKSDT
jgi:DNA-binding beta-propeller fold protein YncE